MFQLGAAKPLATPSGKHHYAGLMWSSLWLNEPVSVLFHLFCTIVVIVLTMTQL